jgi:hypothetical protein
MTTHDERMQMYAFLTRYLATTALLTTVLYAPPLAMAQTAAGDMAAVKAIDTDCLAIQNATMALHPVHVALVQSKWTVLSDADYAVAQQTTTSVAFADVWKTKTGYAWVHAHSFDAQGNQRATQLCFRQKDFAGTSPSSGHRSGSRRRSREGCLLRKRRHGHLFCDRVRRERSDADQDHPGAAVL